MTVELYRQNVGWEDKIDADSEAQRLKAYCATRVRCAHGHHRPKSEEDSPCPVCHSLIPYAVEGYPEVA
jgi:hypothetical protein